MYLLWGGIPALDPHTRILLGKTSLLNGIYVTILLHKQCLVILQPFSDFRITHISVSSGSWRRKCLPLKMRWVSSTTRIGRCVSKQGELRGRSADSKTNIRSWKQNPGSGRRLPFVAKVCGLTHLHFLSLLLLIEFLKIDDFLNEWIYSIEGNYN